MSDAVTTTIIQTVTTTTTSNMANASAGSRDEAGQRFGALRNRSGSIGDANGPTRAIAGGSTSNPNTRSRSSSMTKRHVMTDIPPSNLQNQREPGNVEDVPVGHGLNNDGTLKDYLGDYASPTPAGPQQQRPRSSAMPTATTAPAPAPRQDANAAPTFIAAAPAADPKPRDAPAADREQLAGANQWGGEAPVRQQQRAAEETPTVLNDKPSKTSGSGALCCGSSDPAVKEAKERAKAEEKADKERRKAEEIAEKERKKAEEKAEKERKRADNEAQRLHRIEEAEKQRAIEEAAKEKEKARKNLERAEREARKKASAAVDAETEKRHAKELLREAEEKAIMAAK